MRNSVLKLKNLKGNCQSAYFQARIENHEKVIEINSGWKSIGVQRKNCFIEHEAIN